jgi:carboxylate-amine ligase
MSELDFKASADLSMGVELELQILNSRDFNLARDAADLIGLVDKTPHPGEIKPEITESMVELNSSIHTRHAALVAELRELRDCVSAAARRLNVCIAGGGSHPFHQWTERRIYPTERFNQLLDTYGYLAKQFTVFGQHVHVGCPSGDDAIYLTHMLSRYVPHMIALSVSSPFQQGADTGFQSSRLNTVSAFPLSGTMPFVGTWDEFRAYFDKMRAFGIVESMKDFYWDIRPKPEYGTVEVRVFDTPLTVERAAAIGAFVQALSRWMLNERPRQPSPDLYLVYRYNRFQACRYGLEGKFIDYETQATMTLREDLLATLRALAPHAEALESALALEDLRRLAETGASDARWLRETHTAQGSLSDVARLQSERWMQAAAVPA